ILVIDAHLVEQIHEGFRGVITDLVVRQLIETRDDFVEVFAILAAHGLFGEPMLGHVHVYGGADDGIVGERSPRQTRLLLLVATQPSAELVNEPPSFFSCAYPIPLSFVMRMLMGGCVARASASHPS